MLTSCVLNSLITLRYLWLPGKCDWLLPVTPGMGRLLEAEVARCWLRGGCGFCTTLPQELGPNRRMNS